MNKDIFMNADGFDGEVPETTPEPLSTPDDDDDSDDGCSNPMPPYHHEDKYIDGLKSVKPHPNNPTSLTKEILNKPVNEATLFEQALMDATSHYAIIHKFFDNDFVMQSFGLNTLESNVFGHGIYCLQLENKLKLYSLEPDAAMSEIKIAPNVKAHIPSCGKFVLEIDNESVVLVLYRYNDSTNYEICALTYEIADKIINIIKRKADECNFYRNKVFAFEGNFISLPSLTLENAILPEQITTEINTNVVKFFKHTANILEAYNLPSKRGLIFCGEPGVGKSFTARVLAATLGVTFIVVTNVRNKEEIKSIYTFARKITPAVILFEDIDIYLFDRNSGDSKLAVLLNELDGMEENKKIVTILTTNKLDVLDKAIKERPGRFDRILQFELPSPELIKHMLKVFSEKVDTTQVDFDILVNTFKDKKFSGAHLKEIVITACMTYVENLEDPSDKIVLITQDFINAADKLFAPKNKRMGFKN